MKAPNGLEEIVKVFGNPRDYLRSDGTLSPQWEEKKIVRVKLPAPIHYEDTLVTKVTAHIVIAKIVEATFLEIFSLGHWGDLKEYGGGFVARAKRTSSKLSCHTWGIAYDLNPSTNAQGTDGNMPKEIIAIFERHGWFWGGNFHGASKDPMHFQFATGY